MSDSVEKALVDYNKDLENLNNKFKSDLSSLLAPEIEATLLEPTVIDAIKLHLVSKHPHLKCHSAFSDKFLEELMISFIKTNRSCIPIHSLGSQLSLDYYNGIKSKENGSVLTLATDLDMFEGMPFKGMRYGKAVYRNDTPMDLAKLVHGFSSILMLEGVHFDLTDDGLLTKLKDECPDIIYNITSVKDVCDYQSKLSGAVSVLKDVGNSKYMFLSMSFASNRNIFRILKCILGFYGIPLDRVEIEF